MTQIERSKLIKYRWWRDDEEDIKPEHIPALEESADERIAEMLKQGFTSGELKDNIHMTDDDPEDGVEYKGFWEFSPANNQKGETMSETTANPNVEAVDLDRLVLPAVEGNMECSNAEFERRCLIYLAQEQDKLSPDNALIAVLCDGVRLAREYSAAMNRQNTEVSHKRSEE